MKNYLRLKEFFKFKEIQVKLTLVRHGETLWNKEKKIQGSTDIALSDSGIEQAEKLSLSMKDEDLDAIVTSPLKRAHDTARTIGKYHHLTIKVENDLRELNAGEFEGLTYADLLPKYPDFLSQWRIDHAAVVMPKGESLQEVQDRVWPVIKRITETSHNALVVSHSFVIITILCKMQNLNLSHSTNMRISVASKTCLEVENGFTKLTLFNDTGHLKDAERTL